MMEWINYKERQPDARGVYLVRLSDGQIKVMAYETAFVRVMPMVKYSEKTAGWYTEEPESDRIFEVTNVTHWMPLPEPPTVGEVEMTNREKIINGLECLANDNAACSSDCPYYENRVPASCFRAMARDALELLREQKSVEPDGEKCEYTLHQINYDGPDEGLPDRKKVLKALEHHKETAVCNGCPYAGDDDTPQGYCPVYDDALALLREQKMGHWVFLKNCSNSGVYCSECNTKVFDRYPFKKKFSYFCPHCGTRMEGEVERL